MRRRQLNTLFAIFFDPAVPIAFFAGSIVLAILGNGVYDLLVEALNGVPHKLWYIVVGALLIFLFIVFGLWLWFRMRRPIVVTIVPKEREANPHAALILCVSPGDIETGNEIHAINAHTRNGTLRHCWMIVSPEAIGKAQQLRELLRQKQVEPHRIDIIDGYQARLAYNAVERALDEVLAVPEKLSIVVDITGGTRPMAAGAVLACRDYGLPMEYVLGQYTDGFLDRAAIPQIMKVDLG